MKIDLKKVECLALSIHDAINIINKDELLRNSVFENEKKSNKKINLFLQVYYLKNINIL